MNIIKITFAFFILSYLAYSQPVPGAYDTKEYLSLLKNKKVGLIINQTSVIGKVQLLDTLLSLKINVVKVFAPEHGFRGDADAGEKVDNSIDKKTGIPIISLYGKNKKPSKEQLIDLDVLVFDIQDVGCRFYTYISTLHYVMESCSESKKFLIVLDRPNPNGMYIDGPVLDTSLRSFVGMHPVPIVYGMTIGEYATMIEGERWIKSVSGYQLSVIKNKKYTHSSEYSLPVKPSPNLPNDLSIALYPSLCLFEGTNISVARGTQFPFQAIGFPDSSYGDFTFTPESIPGMAKDPMHQGKKCFGIDLRQNGKEHMFTINYVIEFYKKSGDKSAYFNNFFKKLIGNELVMKQIQEGQSDLVIRRFWENDLIKFKKIRKKYLLYTDFE